MTPNQPYSLGQYYDSGLDICVNPLVGLAQLNDACITMGPTSSSYAHYPWVAGYDLANCQGEPSSNFSVPVGCIDNSNLVDDNDDYSVTPSLMISELYDNKWKSSNTIEIEPLFPTPSPNSDRERHVVRQYQTLQNSLAKLSSRIETLKNEKYDRELGLWYQDDDPNEFETFTYTYIPGKSSTTNSDSLTGGAIVGIVIGVIAITVFIGVGIAVFFCGWTMFGLIDVNQSKKNDVAPNLELSFDYGNKSTTHSITNPILTPQSNNSKTGEKINFDLA